jgi:adenosylcobinamide-GDP ribazoletransferase
VRAALAFLTPIGGARKPNGRTLSWFPLAGGAIGATLGVVWWTADRIWPAAVAAALIVTADLALTGMLHLDGLVDAADGLLPHLERERRFAVMSEPTVGAFGIGAAGAVLLLRYTALAATPPNIALLASLWCMSRTVMAAAGRGVPYAKDAGLLSAFTGSDWRPVAAYGSAVAVGLAAIVGPHAIAAVVAAGTAGVAIVWFARVRLGGVTGDVLGAAGIIAETVGLLAAAAR